MSQNFYDIKIISFLRNYFSKHLPIHCYLSLGTVLPQTPYTFRILKNWTEPIEMLHVSIIQFPIGQLKFLFKLSGQLISNLKKPSFLFFVLTIRGRLKLCNASEGPVSGFHDTFTISNFREIAVAHATFNIFYVVSPRQM